MRRKSERTVKSSPTKRTENTPRRTSRRTRKTPEKSIADEESENNSSDQASSSENEAEVVVAPKRTKRTSRTIEKSSSAEDLKPTTTTRTRRKAANKKEVETIEEEQTDASQATAEKSESESKEEVTATGSVEITESASVDSSTEPTTVSEGHNDSNHEQQNEIKVEEVKPEAKPEARAEAEAEVQPEAKSEAKPDAKPEAETPQSNDNEVASVTVATSEEAVQVETTKVEAEEQPEAPVEKPSRRRTLRRLEKEPIVIDVIATVKDAEITENITSNHESSEADKTNDDSEANKDKEEENKLDDKNESPQQSEAGEEPKENGDSKTEVKVAKKQPIVRKRKWLSNKTSAPKVQEITISTDSLKGLISDVKPVPLSDVKLDSSPEIDHESDDVKVVSSTSLDYNRHSEERVSESADDTINISTTRKISIVNESDEQQPLSPAKHNPCNILYITNLVRPFTVLQLKSLLQRTGKIVENGFWMDKIKSKCFVKYETEDEAVETRHALHGIRWPSSNPKCLNVDFGTENLMDKAIASTADDTKAFSTTRDERVVSSNDLREVSRERQNVTDRPIREWDLGKKSDLRRSRERDRPERVEDVEKQRPLRDGDRDRERNRDRRRRSASASPNRKFAKKDNEPPLRLLDDLFRKTKTAPCVYWLPLTPEQIAVREEERQKAIQRRVALNKEREREENEERQRRREREKRRQASREKERERRPDSRERDRHRDRNDRGGDRDRRR